MPSNGKNAREKRRAVRMSIKTPGAKTSNMTKPCAFSNCVYLVLGDKDKYCQAHKKLEGK